MVGTGTVSTTRREIPSYPPPWLTVWHCERRTPSLEQVWVEPRAVWKEPSEIWKQRSSLSTCRESSKAEYQTLQLGSCKTVSHYSHGLFVGFRFQAFSSYLKVKRAQYTARSKWKSQTKSFEAFGGLFRFRAMNNVINGHICCIFNSLYKHIQHAIRKQFLSHSTKPAKSVSPVSPCSQQDKQAGNGGNGCLRRRGQSTTTLVANHSLSGWAVWRDTSHPSTSLIPATFSWLNTSLSPEFAYSMIRGLQTP